MRLEEVRAIHKKTGQKYKRKCQPDWIFEDGGERFRKENKDSYNFDIHDQFFIDLHKYGISIRAMCKHDMDADDWEVELLPEKTEIQKQDERDLEFLNKLHQETSVWLNGETYSLNNKVIILSRIIKRKCFGVNE